MHVKKLTKKMLIQENNNRITEAYAKRCLLLAATCILTTFNQFLSKNFSIGNEILAVYFQISLALLDWAYVGLYARATLSTPVLQCRRQSNGSEGALK